MVFIAFLYAVVSCFICYKLAHQKNKNNLTAAIAGFFLGIFAILYYGFSEKEEPKEITPKEDVKQDTSTNESEPLFEPQGSLKVLLNGIIKENPTFVLLLGMCPTLGTTSSAINGMSMGLATMAVLIFSNLIISLIKNLIPDMVRIPSFIVVIASLVTILQMLIKAYAPEVDASLGLFIPLIVVNCIILGRAEAFAAKNGVISSVCDGIGMGIGFTLALTLLGAARELLGTGKVFNTTLFPEEYGALVFVLAPGAFIALGYLIAIFNKFKKA